MSVENIELEIQMLRQIEDLVRDLRQKKEAQVRGLLLSAPKKVTKKS